MPQKTFIDKEEKRAPGFKVGRNRVTLLFCANAVGLHLQRTDQLPVFWLYKKTWIVRILFGDLFHRCFVPEVRKYLASKELPFKVLLILDKVLATQMLLSSTANALKWPTCPQAQPLRCSLD